MEKRLKISEELSLPIDAVTQTFGILAIRGAGKSNTAAVTAEQMFHAKLPFVVIDPHGTWWGLRSSFDGKGSGLSIPIFGGRKGDVPLDPAGGSVVADVIVDERLSCVLDISEFSESDKNRFLAEFAQRLYRRNEQPLHLFLEEADDYIPQKPGRNQLAVLGAFETIVRRGRARGLGITMITQRSAVLNKNVLTQIETLIVMRTTSPQDRKAIEAWVDYYGQSRELVNSLPTLENGEAWVWSPHWLKRIERVKINRRSTFDSAATPKELAKRPAATLADVDLEAIQTKMAATIERAKADDPKELKKRNRELEADLRRLSSDRTARIDQSAIDSAVKAAVNDFEARERRLLKAFADFRDRAREIASQMSLLIEAAIDAAESVVRIARPSESPKAKLDPFQFKKPAASTKSSVPSATQTDEELGRMGMKMLTALAQHPNGLTKKQILIFTGYRSSGPTSRMFTLLLREGLADSPAANTLRISAAGAARLGDFEPLPKGYRLRQKLLQEAGPMESKFLEALFEVYPESISKGELLDRTGYKSSGPTSSMFTKLCAVNYAEKAGSNRLRASDELFQE